MSERSYHILRKRQTNFNKWLVGFALLIVSIFGTALLFLSSARATVNDLPLITDFTSVKDSGCSGCSVAWNGTSNTLTATIAGGTDTKDTAYGLKDFGGSTGWTGMTYSRTILEDYAALMRQLYSPQRYFGRVLAAVRRLTRHPKQVGSMRGRWTDIRALGALIWRLGCRPGTSWYFWRTVLVVLMTRRNNFATAFHLMALFLHFRKHARFVIEWHAARLEAEREESCRPSETLPWSREAPES